MFKVSLFVGFSCACAWYVGHSVPASRCFHLLYLVHVYCISASSEQHCPNTGLVNVFSCYANMLPILHEIHVVDVSVDVGKLHAYIE